MDLAFTPQELAFRDEIRSWVKDNLPADIAHKVHNALRLSRDDMQRWAKILGKKGWLGYGWPQQFGGSGLARQHGFTNLEYRLGDLENPPVDAGSIDLVLLSQALHHAQRPAQALRAAFSLLKPGGRIAILDLLRHQFEKARELYADVWLGFTEAELHEMLSEAGFHGIETSIVHRETRSPHFQTVLAIAERP